MSFRKSRTICISLLCIWITCASKVVMPPDHVMYPTIPDDSSYSSGVHISHGHHRPKNHRNKSIPCSQKTPMNFSWHQFHSNHNQSHPHLSSSTWMIQLTYKCSVNQFKRISKRMNKYFRVRYEFKKVWHGVSVEFRHHVVHCREKKMDMVLKWLEHSKCVSHIWPTMKHSRSNYKKYSISSPELAKLVEFPALSKATKVSQVRRELGLSGKGIKVGIIDTGIDYTHPALGGCFGDGCRVAFGWDFVGDEYGDTSKVPAADSDPMDCDGHGTHVTGIVGANDTVTLLTGVAPNVVFGAYRIFGCVGGTDSDVITAALERAYNENVDIINMSLGDGPGWPEHPSSMAANRVAEMGVVVVAAAGNGGDQGLFEVNVPSVAELVTSVASFENSWYFSKTFAVSPGGRKYQYGEENDSTIDASNLQLVLAEKYDIDTLPEDDACAATENANFSGKIVLVRRGTCTFDIKAKNLQSKGARAIIVYDNKESMQPLVPSISKSITIPVVGITQKDGLDILKTMAMGNVNLTVQWSNVVEVFKNPTGRTISDFSSPGLTPSLELKPDLGAPGGLIFSTFPLKLGGYKTLSGTSMASPYIAGAVALLLEAYPLLRQLKPRYLVNKVIQSMLLNTAEPMETLDGILEAPLKQGAGLVNIKQAIVAQTAVYPPKLQLRQLSENQSCSMSMEFYVINLSNCSMTYSLSHLPSISTNATNVYEPSVSKRPNLNVKFDQTKFELDPNQIKLIKVNLTLHQSFLSSPETNENWILGGYICVRGMHDTIHIPYAGYNGTLDNMPVLDPGVSISSPNNSFPQVYSPKLDSVIQSMASFSLNASSGDYPVLRFRLLTGSPRIDVLLVNASNNQVVGVVDSLEYLGRNDNSEPGPDGSEWYEIPFKGIFILDDGQTRRLKERSLSGTELWNALMGQEDEGDLNEVVVRKQMQGIPLLAATILSNFPFTPTPSSANPSKPDNLTSTNVTCGTYQFRIKAFKPLDSANTNNFETWDSERFEIKSTAHGP